MRRSWPEGVGSTGLGKVTQASAGVEVTPSIVGDGVVVRRDRAAKGSHGLTPYLYLACRVLAKHSARQESSEAGHVEGRLLAESLWAS